MRIVRLDLAAFGPFTERSLDFSGGAPGGLHLVYGKNAAGKSSALRAVSDLLFGIPVKSSDDHVHPYPALRIRALLESHGGERLLLQRLKRNKDSLRDENDTPLDEARLKRLLGSVDRPMFERVFGLDHERLRDAGRSLLEGGGDVGESLFDAGAGGQGVRRVLLRLREEAERLFKPHGGKQEIPQLLEKYKAARERVRAAAHPPEVYVEQQKEFDRLRVEGETLAQELSTLRHERERGRMLQAALKGIANREKALAELALLGNLPELASDFSAERERVQAELQNRRASVERALREIQRLHARKAELNPPAALLAVGEDAMNSLREGIGSTKKALVDLPAREAELAQHRTEAQVVERRLGLDSSSTSEALRARRPEEVRFRRLLAERAAPIERWRAAGERLSQLEVDCDTQRARLEALPAPVDAEPLERAVQLARHVGDVEGALRTLAGERAELDLLCKAELATLAPFAGSLADLCTLRVPSVETVIRFEQAFAKVEERKRSIAGELERLRGRAAALSIELAAEERAGAVPSEVELDRSRRGRDERFEKLCESWRTPTSSSLSAFDDAMLVDYRSSVGAADALADRLRREAARVAENARRAGELAQIVEEQSRLRAIDAELVEAGQTLARDWASSWAVAELRAIQPAETRAWLTRRERAVDLVVKERALRERETALRAQVEELSRVLTAALGPLTPATPLAIQIASASERLDQERALAAQRNALNGQIAELEVRCAAARRDLEAREREAKQRESELNQAIGALGFGSSISAEEVEARLEALADLLRAREQTSDLERRIAGMKRDIAAFDNEVNALVLAHAVELAELPTWRAASELVLRFDRGRRDAEALERLQAELAERQVELEEEGLQLRQAEAALHALIVAARANDPSELPRIEAKVRRARELRAELAGLEATLSETAGARGLPALLEEAAATDRARIAARLEELDRLIEQLEEQHSDSIRAHQRVQAGLELFADTSAAEAADEERSLASALAVRAERWAKFKLAEVLLEREIERYRQENQGPVLRRAQDLFVRLTRDQYRGLRVGREERALVAVRANDIEVTVAGLNEAARYHLYLALRLASLERYLEHAEALPLVLDDILIHFDEEGARAALGVLGGMASRMQVLLFTHHRHNVDLAQSAVPEKRLFVHEL